MKIFAGICNYKNEYGNHSSDWSYFLASDEKDAERIYESYLNKKGIKPKISASFKGYTIDEVIPKTEKELMDLI